MESDIPRRNFLGKVVTTTAAMALGGEKAFAQLEKKELSEREQLIHLIIEQIKEAIKSEFKPSNKSEEESGGFKEFREKLENCIWGEIEEIPENVWLKILWRDLRLTYFMTTPTENTGTISLIAVNEDNSIRIETDYINIPISAAEEQMESTAKKLIKDFVQKVDTQIKVSNS